jgi:site-specific recombinase XerD
MIITLLKRQTNMGKALTTTNQSAELEKVIKLATDGLTSAHSRRAYEKALTDFMAWYSATGKPGLTKAVVQEYKTVLQSSGLSSSTINVRMSAIRKLAQEAADNGLIDQSHANGVGRVKGVKSSGVRAGNWLTHDQAQALINLPNLETLKGLRDRAILSVMIGAGLRRSEVAALDFAHIQQREGRWVIVDLVGKGNRVRTIPMPSWTKAAVDEWTKAAAINTGRVFRPIHKGGFLTGDTLTPQAVRDVVAEYGQALGVDVAAHDLRRTFAKLAHKGGSGVDQIQLSLGHASLKTTEKYLGVDQSLTDAPCDHLGLTL